MEEFDRLVQIFETLRAPGGCPWDAEQDHRSIARCVIEEAYELFDAIETGDADHMREELGDVLLQVVFHSIIARDAGEFDLKDVIDGLAEKLVFRHPHVFGDVRADDSDAVKRNWEKLKGAEKGKTDRTSILDGIPVSLPSLQAARKIQSTVSRVGFDWKDATGVLDKIREETGELAEAMEAGDAEAVAEEIGDLLFSVVNLARLAGVDPESALRSTNRKFCSRFAAIEEEAARRGMGLDEMTLEEMDAIWEKAKKHPKIPV
ncbi:MAG TPA: nucleoside triphosphate pyrophosphohydrolase [Deltaproteobacteria bacterium]|nr:nucleoside triphosphate pyrophosphohydrolase [Deltaproteobacteria bacterium]HPR55573.1 nucleoside triphosphate pyrophosphohydrolase [Deltaproteobacteria bacterium]HXK46012.1 nucleoside triphosphate pyrophosphohydrolase [Deltaproteobacteria bacterium]